MELQVGSILEGKVTSITKFGAFGALDNGKSGLVHISEIANTFVNDVHDYLQEGQAMKTLPLGTAYAVWTGIGAVGSVAVGILIFKEPVTAARMFFTVLLLTGIVGIKLTSSH